MLSRPSRSTLEIKVGLTAEGEVRSELRSWSDCKPAHMGDNSVEAERPKRGRPRSSNSNASPQHQNTSPTKDQTTNQNKPSPNLSIQNEGGNSTRPTRSTRNPQPNYVALVSAMDFSKPPPMAPNSNVFAPHAEQKPWSASITEINAINASICRNSALTSRQY